MRMKWSFHRDTHFVRSATQLSSEEARQIWRSGETERRPRGAGDRTSNDAPEGFAGNPPNRLNFETGDIVPGHRSNRFGKSVFRTTDSKRRLRTPSVSPHPRGLLPVSGATSRSHSTRYSSVKGGPCLFCTQRKGVRKRSQTTQVHVWPNLSPQKREPQISDKYFSRVSNKLNRRDMRLLSNYSTTKGKFKKPSQWSLGKKWERRKTYNVSEKNNWIKCL